MRLVHIFALGFVVTLGSAAPTFAQSGPVAIACKDDIHKLCAGKEHGQGEVRACLEANKEKVSPACREALETTGGGR
jgi:hypothetical protein